MSATFDPSKLDLNPDNESVKLDVSQDTKPSTTGEPAQDILGEVEIPRLESVPEPISDPLSETSVLSEETPEIENADSIEDRSNTESTGTILDEIVDDTSVKQESEPQEDKKLIDINISSLEDIISLIQDKKYDFVLVEPEDMQVKVTFKQDNIDRDVRYIKYPTYTNILFKVKQVCKLTIEDTGSPQEGKWSFKMWSKMYKISSKTAPGQNGERIYISAKEDTSIAAKKEAKKTSLSVIFWFLAAILFVALILWGAFIGFIVLNAKTVEDVKFFASLWIDLNQINTFITLVVSIIFSILLFICTAVLSISLFKFFLTKKSLKRRKVLYGILSTLLLFTTFAIWSAWMFIDNKIKSLPNWQEQAYWDLKIFDNSLLISEDYGTAEALLDDTQNLLWPIDLQFDLENFRDNQARKWITISKYVWDFWGDESETFSPNITRSFNEKWNYEISVTAIGTDSWGEEVEQVLWNIPSVSISHVIEVDETITNSGGKKVGFDANDLDDLWKVEWYLKEPYTESNTDPRYPEWQKVSDWYEFIIPFNIFEELLVGVRIVSGNDDSENFKIIIISSDSATEISGDIVTTANNLNNELLYTLKVENASTNFWNGFIERYDWEIEWKTYTVDWNFNDPTTSPDIEHEFKSFWEPEVQVTLTDSRWKTQILTETINIQKKVELRSSLIIRDIDGKEIDELRHEKNSHEYSIDNLWIPAIIKLDARFVRPVNLAYSLQEVKWDIDDDGDIDANGKSYDFDVPTEWNHAISVEYSFVHLKDKDDIIKLKEFVYIEWIKKDAILNLKMEFNTNYVPVLVRFDASESFIKNDDIVKFIYDYWDGISEERDAINPGHRYTEAWDYTVTLTAVWASGKRYSVEKSLILLPTPQEVQITTSLKKAPEGQGIDFSSSNSSGQIIEYFWDFWDGNISTQANPTHSFSRAWTYTVELKAEFSNRNSISDKVEIEIFEEEL